MSPELQHALVYLLGVVAISVPATLRALSRASADHAGAEKTAADTVQAAMAALGARLDEISAAHAACERQHREALAQIARLERRSAADEEVVARFAERIDALEKQNRAQRDEIVELRRAIASATTTTGRKDR